MPRAKDPAARVLSVEGVTLHFGGLRALHNVNMEVAEGRIHALIGPNGAGKTSVLNTISGYYEPDKGTVRWSGDDILGRQIFEIARMGIRRTYQNLQLFERLTAADNIALGGPKYGRRHGAEGEGAWDELIELLDLGPILSTPASDLPYGMQRMVELARAFAGSPELVLLDEPAAGLNDGEARLLGEVLQALVARWGVGVLIIEHNVQLVMQIAESITVLDHGEVLAVGSPEHVANSPKVREAYLGTSTE